MTTAETTHDVAVLEGLLLRMWQIRAFEIRAMELFEEKLIRGSVHPYVGMEAIAVGACAALGPDDYITSTHRGHGHCVAKGLDLKLMMAEIIGREDGYCRGRGGSMHITAMDKGMLGADAIVAGSSAIAVGAAHGLRLQGRDSVVLCFFGDGAANQGILHEACNLAAVLSAPVVFLCENNEWAISTPAAASTRIDDIADRAAGYGFPGVVADGNDVLGMREVTAAAVGRARAGDGPTLIEAKSYRVTPHSAATKTDLRPPDELDAWRARDPILRFSRYLSGEAGIEPARLEEIEEQARRDVEEAVEFAKASPRPEPEAAIEDVYAPADWLTPGRLA
jgi:acetoin:2,6-dichlorophenolindophenol oxidoreductase subunit alpha